MYLSDEQQTVAVAKHVREWRAEITEFAEWVHALFDTDFKVMP